MVISWSNANDDNPSVLSVSSLVSPPATGTKVHAQLDETRVPIPYLCCKRKEKNLLLVQGKQCDSNTKHLSGYIHFIVPRNMDSHKKVLRMCSCLRLTIISKHLPLWGLSTEPFCKFMWGQTIGQMLTASLKSEPLISMVHLPLGFQLSG